MIILTIRFTLTPSATKTETGQPSSWTAEKKPLSQKYIEFPSVNVKVSGEKVIDGNYSFYLCNLIDIYAADRFFFLFILFYLSLLN